MSVIGTDVSRWQPDWQPAPEDEFVIVKSTQGTTYRSPTYAKQLSIARANEMLIGHYHYLEPGFAADQARHFLASSDIRDGDTLWCDWEGDWSADRHPSVEDAAAFIAVVKQARPFTKVGLYCNASDWRSTTVKQGDALWIAHYGVDQPGIRQPWDLHQYTDDPIDKNRSSLSTLDELRVWWTSPPEGTPAPTGDPISDMIATLPVKHSTTPPADYVTYQGEHFLPLDLEIILRCAAAVGWGPVTFIKGGLEGEGGVSASTHAFFGAADVRTKDHTTAQTWDFAAMLIRSGIVGFPRGYGRDSFAKHMHLASREAGMLAHRTLRAQITEFQDGGDGLVGSKAYHGPSVRLGTWKQSPVNPSNITANTGTYTVTTDGDPLLGRDVDRKIRARAENGSALTAVRQVERWGRPNIVTSDELYYAMQYLEPVPDKVE